MTPLQSVVSQPFLPGGADNPPNVRLQARAARGASPCKLLFGGTPALSALSWPAALARSGHSIILSARSRSSCEMVRPSFLAVVRLIVNSRIIGCSTGNSLGFAPLSILST